MQDAAESNERDEVARNNTNKCKWAEHLNGNGNRMWGRHGRAT
jgi:hypothetical protein